MNITLKYIGSQSRWPELLYTGQQSVWTPGMIDTRDSAEAGKLLKTGFFENLSDDVLSPLSVAMVLAAAPQRYTIGLGLFGDSVTWQGYYNSIDATTGWYDAAASDNYERSRGWSTWVAPLSMQRIQVVKCWARATNGLLAAGSGYPLSVQVTQALADPSWSLVTRAVILIGTNDPAFTIEACTAELLAQIRRIGKPVDLIASPPTNGSTATSGNSPLPYWGWILEWRATLKRIADNSGGWIRFIDGYTVLANPSTSPAVWAGGHTNDNTHPNNVGAYKIADAYVQSIFPTGIGGDLDIWTHNSSAASTNCALLDQGFVNPVLATDSGGSGTGVVAGSLTITNIGTATHTGSVSANTITGGTGNMQTIAVVSNAAGDGVDVAFTSFHAAGGQFLTAGDKAWAQCLLRLNSGGIYPRNAYWRLQGFQSPTNYNVVWGSEDTANELALPLSATRTFLPRTPMLITPSGAAFSTVTMRLRVTFAGSGSSSFDIGNLETRRFRVGGVYA